VTVATDVSFTDEQQLRYLADALFAFTDLKDWASATALFVEGPVEVDMSSLVGGGPTTMTAAELFVGFDRGLHAKKPSHHMATNYRIAVDEDTAELWAHGYAWNRLEDYGGGSDLWETWGNYRLTMHRGPDGWKMDGFRYYAKFNRGNEYVRTHSL
jgi:hypothetical protein